MKKFLLAAIFCLTIIVATAQVEKAYPAQDTWVLSWDGYNYYVKAGTFDYTPGHPDAAPEFSCYVAYNGEVHHYKFHARGYAVLYVDGKLYGDSQKSRFIDAMYNGICNKLIYHR